MTYWKVGVLASYYNFSSSVNAVVGEYGFPSPDLMIVHRKPPAGRLRSPVESAGFPPWQLHLTEM